MMIRSLVVLLMSTLPAFATGTFTCSQLERVSLAEEGSMRPVYKDRILNFEWTATNLSGDGVFYHDAYDISPHGENGFRAHAENADRSDLFRFEDNILMHTAIVKYGRDPSIQSQVFRCTPVN